MRLLDRNRAAAFFWAAIIDIVAVGTVLIIHERSSALRVFLNRLTGHHWVTMSLVTCVLFPGLTVLLYLMRGRPVFRSWRLTSLAAALAAMTAFLFVGTIVVFVLEYF